MATAMRYASDWAWTGWDAVRDSAYFFADELPAVGEWTFGEAEGRRIAAPTLVVLGAESPPWFHENGELLAAMVPGAETVTLPGMDHLAPLTHPAELGQVIARFVNRLAADRY